ncbi:MAG: ectonucleotide pyrophosphatase/phosphodiesterase [Gemmatimonadales bacterium]
MFLARLALCVALLSSCAQTSGAQPDPPQVVLISIDGFRWDYLDRPEAARLRELASRGVRAERLIPVFPTKTFATHYSIVTGLHPEEHGILANNIWDDKIGKRFTLSDRAVQEDPRWWGGEPIWVTAERQGQRAASYFWPGSDVEIQGVRPTWYRVYNNSTPNDRRVRTVLGWLARDPAEAPTMVTLYFSDVDNAGHRFGPDAPETNAAIAHVDSLIGMLVDGITQRGIAHRVNLIIVSDHGMASTSRDRQIALDNYINMDRVRVVDWSPVLALTPDADYLDEAYRRLKGVHPNLQVYRKGDVPARLRYNNHPRITPIIGLADEGWSITTRARLRTASPEQLDGATHGWDPELVSMGALFVAQGPAFAEGRVVPPVHAINLYELMAHILGLQAAPNSGSLDAVRGVLRSKP